LLGNYQILANWSDSAVLTGEWPDPGRLVEIRLFLARELLDPGQLAKIRPIWVGRDSAVLVGEHQRWHYKKKKIHHLQFATWMGPIIQFLETRL